MASITPPKEYTELVRELQTVFNKYLAKNLQKDSLTCGDFLAATSLLFVDAVRIAEFYTQTEDQILSVRRKALKYLEQMVTDESFRPVSEVVKIQ